MAFGQRSHVIGLRWRGWGGAGAQAAGTLEVNPCQPSCAEARPVRYPVSVTLSRREICGGVWQYRRFQLRYRTDFRPAGVAPRYRETFPCAPSPR